MRLVLVVLALLMTLPATDAQAVDARDRSFLSVGMGEGEVVLKIGKPDHEAIVKSVKGQPEEKTWSYFPHPRDPQTLTVLTFRGGVLDKIDRKISR